MRILRKYITIGILIAATTGVYAQDWPQYFGPTRDGVSTQRNVLRTWPENGPDVLWTVDIGRGYGGPVIKDGKVYLLDRDDEVGDKLRCFDLCDGKELWSFAYDAPGSVQYPGTRSVPTVDGDRIYSCGPYGDMYCVEIYTHQPLWNKNIWKDFGGDKIPTWAITQCPLIYDSLVIVASQAPGAGVVAYNKVTGDLVWQTPPIGRAGYVSPSLVKVGSEDHVVMICASQGRGENASGGKVVGIDPHTGNMLWEYNNWQCSIPVPAAVDAGDGKVLITGGYEAGSAMIRVTKNEDESYSVTELYKNLEFGAHTQQPVFYDGYFYAQYSTNERKDGLACMSIDGEVKWKTKRDPSFDKGGIIVADGLLICTDGRTGLYLVEPDSAAFHPVAFYDALKEEVVTSEEGQTTSRPRAVQNWAPLAISDGKLLIRDQSRMMCVRIAE